MSQMQVNSTQFYRELMAEFHNRDFDSFQSIFNPPEEFFEDQEDPVTLANIEHWIGEGAYADKHGKWKFLQDVNDALNIWLNCTPENTDTYNKVQELHEFFGSKMDKFMKNHGYCCGYWYIYQAKNILCSGSTEKDPCEIADEEDFYRYENFSFCSDCFKEKTKGTPGMIQLNSELTIKCTQMVKYKFRKEIIEPMVTCEKCGKLFHERCVIHIHGLCEPFYCVFCRPFRDFRFDCKVSNKAPLIPSTDCDTFITNFVEKNMKKTYGDEMTIRMLNCNKCSFKVERKILENCGGIPDTINYILCTIFAFFKEPEGNDVCFFTLFAQLYGEDAPRPNEKAAYISYIDSVKLYTGSDRTKLYHTIILGLIEYLRGHGYEKVFIWSCPPDSGVDYVFPFKPPVQKMPDSNILDEWYVKMFEKGKKMKIIEEVQGVESFSFHNHWEDIKNVPLFSEDLWISKLSEVITQAENEYAKLKSTFRAAGQGRCDNKNEKIWELLQNETKAFDQSYFILKLKNPNVDLLEIQGVAREWIGNRHFLFDFFCESKLMFRDIRQARYATYRLLYRVFMELSYCISCGEKEDLDTYLFCNECTRTAKNGHRYYTRRTDEERNIIDEYHARMRALL